MTREFDAGYAAAYDALYREKDYEAECDLLEAAFRKHSRKKVERILDLGCGTGNHAVPLARRGYEVAGVDRSPHMLRAARDKAGAAVRFVEADVRGVDLGESFDAVLLMFAVLGYQLENDDVLAALRSARRHLGEGGLLIFDVWYGPAVLKERPGPRIKVVEKDDGPLIRATSGRLDVHRHVCEVSYRLLRLVPERRVEETSEVHRMRFFFPQELRLFLASAGFSLCSLTAFPTLDEPCGETTWNALAVAVATEENLF